MIVLRMELWPQGDRSRARLLGLATITNKDTGNQQRGDYRIEFSKQGGNGTWMTGEVRDFPRKRLGAWDLLYRALHAIVANRNRED